MKKVGMVSLGCAKNRVDSEVILGTLKEAGLRDRLRPAEAEIIFVNTCGFIEPAKEESIEAIFEMAKYKETGRLKKLFVTGCLAQRYNRRPLREMPEVDGFMGVADYTRLLEMMQEAEAGGRPPLRLRRRALFSRRARVDHARLLCLRENFRRLRQPLQLLRHPPHPRAVPLAGPLTASSKNAANWPRAV